MLPTSSADQLCASGEAPIDWHLPSGRLVIVAGRHARCSLSAGCLTPAATAGGLQTEHAGFSGEPACSGVCAV